MNTKILISFATLAFALSSFAAEKGTAQKKGMTPPKKAISRSPASSCLCANDLSDAEKTMIELASEQSGAQEGTGTVSQGLQARMQDTAADFTVVSGGLNEKETLNYVKKNIDLLDPNELEILRRILVKKKPK